MGKPFFSIVMPVYNGEKYLNIAIDSVINQTFKDWELLIVDDGSTDNSVKLIEQYKDKRITLIKINHSGSANVARKSAFSVAKGEFIQILDCDDYISRDFLEKHHNKLIATQADCVLCDMHYVNNEGDVLNAWTALQNDYETELKGMDAFYYSIDWSIHAVFCTRTELVNNNYIDNKILNADELFSRILFTKCLKVVFDNGIYNYRQNINSSTLSGKNIIHQYETLYTFNELLTIAKSLNAEEYILKKICTEYFKTLVYYNKKKMEDKKKIDKSKERQIIEILKKQFYIVTSYNLDAFDFSSKFKILFVITRNNYSLFNFFCSLMYRLKKGN